MPVAEQLSDLLDLDCRKHFDGKKYLNLSILMAFTTLHVPSRSTGVNSCRFGGSYSVAQHIWYYAHEQNKVKRLCKDMDELLEKKIAMYLNNAY